jgi:hypothetical protein
LADLPQAPFRLIVPSGLAYTEQVLAALLDRGLQPATAFSMHLILFRGFATSLEMEATAEANTGVTADEWMDVQTSVLDAVLADHDLPAFRTVLDSPEPAGYDLDLDELFETGLGYLLAGVRRATWRRACPSAIDSPLGVIAGVATSGPFTELVRRRADARFAADREHRTVTPAHFSSCPIPFARPTPQRREALGSD